MVRNGRVVIANEIDIHRIPEFAGNPCRTAIGEGPVIGRGRVVGQLRPLRIVHRPVADKPVGYGLALRPHRRQNRNDCHDNKQLDKREAFFQNSAL